MEKIIMILSKVLILRCLPVFFVYWRDMNFQKLINEDIVSAIRFSGLRNKEFSMNQLSRLLNFDKLFRRIVYFRLRENHRCLYYISQVLLPFDKHIEISGEIKGGFRIFHGQGCVLNLKRAGENLNVWQGVTIGKGNPLSDGNEDIPEFGNNVKICANACVFGEIIIGDNVVIGAGAVVNKSVPDNSLVVGNPMRVICNETGM